jgi:hypothetical protein
VFVNRIGPFGIALASFLLLRAHPAAADDTTACVEAAEHGQTLRARGKLRAARDAFVAGSAPNCPKATRNDCIRWLGEIDASIPTVVVAATVGGADTTDVGVSIDGERVRDRLDGRAIAIDPGSHVFAFFHDGASVEQRVVIAEGEKNRKLIARFEPAKVRRSESETTTSRPVLGWVLGGIGMAALGSFAFFAASGRSDLADLRNACAPECSDRSVDYARREMLVADISLGAAIISLGAAAVVLLTSR